MYSEKEECKKEIIKRMEEYKTKMLGHFIFDKNRFKNIAPKLKKELVQSIDWPYEGNYLKNGPLWKVVSNYVNVKDMDFIINIGRWNDFYSP